MNSYQVSETESQIQQNNENYESDIENGYKSKMQSIWKNIQKSKNYESHDQSSEEKKEGKQRLEIKKNSLGVKERLRQKEEQIQNKILSNIKQKINTEEMYSYSQSKKIKPDHNQYEDHKHNLNFEQYKANKLKLSASKYQEMQVKLEKAKQNTNILMKKLIQAEEQIQYLQYQLEKEITENQALKEIIDQQSKLDDRKQERKRQDQNILEYKWNQKQNQNEKNLGKDLKDLQINNEKIKFRLRATQKEVQDKNLKIQELQKQLKHKDQLISNLNEKANLQTNLDFPFKGSQLLQLNQAYKTIERLIALLKSTDQFKLLANFAQQVKSIHFLDTIPKNIKSSIGSVKVSNKMKQKQNGCNCMQIRINERLLWSPLLCYKKMLQMKLKYDSLNESCIQEVLFEMNRLYLSKEESRVAKLKNYYENEIEKLKKKTQLRYDQILAKKQIERLKKQIQNSKKKSCNKAQIKLFPSKQNNACNKENEKRLQNLRAIGQYQDQLRLKQKQVKLLFQRVKLLQSQSSTYDKSLYMEGVLWMIDKILEQLDIHSQDIRSFETKFRDKIDMVSSIQDWLRLYKQFFEEVQNLNHSLIQKVLTIKQTTLNKVNSQQK